MRQETPCPLCGGAKAPGFTTFTADLKTGVVVVRGVDAEVCSQCGEAWIADSIAARLEQIVEQARGNKVQLEVAAFH
jgi:YgiT-type zinc finger domain-containing protein